MIQSRLALAIGPDIEMSKYVKKYEIGMIAKDWSAFSLANMIRSTPLSKLIYYKDQSNKYAKDLSSINDNLNFIDLINSYKNA